MTGRGPIGLIIFVIVALILVTNTFYKLSESEQAIITQFGKPIGGAVTRAGLHVKAPFIHKLHRFEKRILIWDGSEDEIPTADKKYIFLDTTARWRIVDPLLFYQSVGNVRGAQGRLDDIIDSAARDVVSSHKLVEVVRNSNEIIEKRSGVTREDDSIIEVYDEIELGREVLTKEMLDRASELVPQYGLEILDVQVKRLKYIEVVLKKVYERMNSERLRIASKYRSEGEGKQAEIVGMKERELNKIQSEAYKKSEDIKGKADARATKIYADSYNKDPEFYSFLKSLDVYRNTLGQNTKAILTTDTDVYRYLKKVKGR